MNSHLENEIKAQGHQIFNSLNSNSKSIFNKDWWYGRIMEWSMKSEAFKTKMFRFVDVLPNLKSNDEVLKHLQEYFVEDKSTGEVPSIFNVGLGVGKLAPGLMAKTIRKNVEQMAKMFITGETPQDALPVLKKSRKNHLAFTVDLLGEATLSEKEAQDYQNRYNELINWLLKDSESWPENPLLDQDSLGPIPKVNVSVKLTSVYSQVNVKAWRDTIDTLKNRIRPIFQLAKEKFVFINIDMESYHYKDLTFAVFKELLMEESFRDYPHFGIVLQAYLRDSYHDLQALVEFAKERGTPFSVRLVKGAYWDYETIHAKQNIWPIPVYTNKKESDANFEKCAYLILDHYPHIKLALASHNIRSISSAIAYAKQNHLSDKAFEIQMLYGMADEIKMALTRLGYRVREYATVGELIPGMAYLVRRLLENTSNESFLRSKFAENTSTETLLSNPADQLSPSSSNTKREDIFQNEALLDFTLSSHRSQFTQAVDQIKTQLGQKYPLVIDNEKTITSETIKSFNPAQPEQLIGEVSMAGLEDAEKAVQSCLKAKESWQKTPASERADLLDRLAQSFLENRYQLAALQVLEVGKTWSEADGDITEAIDFCRYYARHMRELNIPQRVGHAPGEVSLYHYIPRGVSLVIAPWNFPLAILTGMVAASLVTGNTVIMKPAEQSSIVAYQLMEHLIKVGMPKGVVNFLPGYGEVVGEYLTSHKNIDLICFTGSKSVGLHIYNKAAQTQPGQLHVKRCIIEMGGKNAIIIDSDADLDEAVQGVVYSAFGFQGQKCSACSRAIVLEENYDRFLERLIDAVASIKIGSPEDPRSYMGPVVDEEAQKKILSMIERAKKESTLAYQGEVPDVGYFVPPTIFTDVNPQSEIAQEEVFGPVLAVIKAKDMTEALSIANSTEFGLTAGLYSRSPANIEKFKTEMIAGNVYINRQITGALVDRHPFGGVKMSGIGSKTGGPDYLRQFMDPRVVIENTLRRGFAPEEKGDV